MELIDHPEECRMSTDEPYTKFINATEISQKILEKTYLEKYIKTSASLESPAVFAKIWKDIDGAAMKIAKSKVEDVCACLRCTALQSLINFPALGLGIRSGGTQMERLNHRQSRTVSQSPSSSTEASTHRTC